jgi:hypothetical protein
LSAAANIPAGYNEKFCLIYTTVNGQKITSSGWSMVQAKDYSN